MDMTDWLEYFTEGLRLQMKGIQGFRCGVRCGVRHTDFEFAFERIK